jgi:hypothetical protein
MIASPRGDLVDRLHALSRETTLKCWEPRHGAWLSGLREAATRIEQLERDVERLREALREIRDNAHSGDWTLPSSFANRARAALNDGGGG